MYQLIKVITSIFFAISLCACSSQLNLAQSAAMPAVGYGSVMSYGPGASLNIVKLILLNVKANRRVFYDGNFIINTDDKGNAMYTAFLKNTPYDLNVELKNNAGAIVDSSQIKIPALEDKELSIKCIGNIKMICKIDTIRNS